MPRSRRGAKPGRSDKLSLSRIRTRRRICSGRSASVPVSPEVSFLFTRVQPGKERHVMTHAIPESHPLHRLFRGLTEHTFLNELGIGDPGLVGYVANLLARFVRGDT